MTEKEKEPDVSTFKRLEPNPLIKDLPEYLKDFKNYQKVQKAIIVAGATKCSHAEMVDWAVCKKCEEARWNRKEMMKRLGFKNAAQYMAWRKIMEEISNLFKRDKLPKYDD